MNKTDEKILATKLGLSNLEAGWQTIRNDKGWRENERQIKYCWIVEINKALMGSITLFSIKLNATNFR